MLTRLLRALRSFSIPFRSHFSALSHLPFLPRSATLAQPQPSTPTRPKNPAQAISGQPAPRGGGLARDSSPFTPTRIRPLATAACRATPHPQPPAQHPPHHASPSNPSFQPLPTAPQNPAKNHPVAPQEFFRKNSYARKATPFRPLQPPPAANRPNARLFLPRPLGEGWGEGLPGNTPRFSTVAPAHPPGPPQMPPPHLKSFLEETLIAREAPTSARLARRHQSPVPTPDASRPALTPLPSPLSPSSPTPPHLKSFLEKTLTRTNPPHPASQTVPSAAPARPMTSPTVPPLTPATPPNTAIQPRRSALQHSPKHPPPHLKSFLEETLTARETPISTPPTTRPIRALHAQNSRSTLAPRRPQSPLLRSHFSALSPLPFRLHPPPQPDILSPPPVWAVICGGPTRL